MMQATRLAVVCRFHASGRGCAKGAAGGAGAGGAASGGGGGCPFSHDAACPVEYCRAELAAPGSCRAAAGGGGSGGGGGQGRGGGGGDAPPLRCPLSHAPLAPAERRALLSMVEAAERAQQQQFQRGGACGG